MNKDQLLLTEEELKKFTEFFNKHSDCSDEEPRALINIYNVKLVFNVNENSVIPTCYCSYCGEEDLLADPERFSEK